MRKLLVIPALILCIILTSCGREAVRITREEAMPIQTAIDGVLGKDPEQYRSAFPPDYDIAISEEEAMWKYEDSQEYSDFDSYLKSKLNFALAADKVNYGKNTGIEFIVDSVTEIQTGDYASYFESYDDYYVYDYTFDVTKVEKAVLVSGSLNVWGDNSENSTKAEYIIIRIGGIWYLHPAYYYTTFN